MKGFVYAKSGFCGSIVFVFECWNRRNRMNTVFQKRSKFIVQVLVEHGAPFPSTCHGNALN